MCGVAAPYVYGGGGVPVWAPTLALTSASTRLQSGRALPLRRVMPK